MLNAYSIRIQLIVNQPWQILYWFGDRIHGPGDGCTTILQFFLNLFVSVESTYTCWYIFCQCVVSTAFRLSWKRRWNKWGQE